MPKPCLGGQRRPQQAEARVHGASRRVYPFERILRTVSSMNSASNLLADHTCRLSLEPEITPIQTKHERIVLSSFHNYHDNDQKCTGSIIELRGYVMYQDGHAYLHVRDASHRSWAPNTSRKRHVRLCRQHACKHVLGSMHYWKPWKCA